jgi:hypothetical protein
MLTSMPILSVEHRRRLEGESPPRWMENAGEQLFS